MGTFDPNLGRVHVEDEDAVAAWLGVDRVNEAELLTSEGLGARRREMPIALARPDLRPGIRAWVEKEAKRLGLR